MALEAVICSDWFGRNYYFLNMRHTERWAAIFLKK